MIIQLDYSQSIGSGSADGVGAPSVGWSLFGNGVDNVRIVKIGFRDPSGSGTVWDHDSTIGTYPDAEEKRIFCVINQKTNCIISPIDSGSVITSITVTSGIWKDVQIPTHNDNRWEFCQAIRHELGHSLGLNHEHQRPDSGTYVWKNWCAIRDYYDNNNSRANAQYANHSGSTTYVTSYDFLSVMHYTTWRCNCTCNGAVNPTLMTKNCDNGYCNPQYFDYHGRTDFDLRGGWIPQPRLISSKDKQTINNLY